jgi:hypothetical protein
LIEGISDSFKADESEKQATNNLMAQKISTIDLRRRQQQRLYHGARPCSPVLSMIDPAEVIERSRLKAEEDLQALDRVIDSITVGMSRKAFNSRLKALARISFKNASTICDHILAEQTEQNIKPSTAESEVKLLIWVSRYLNHKPFKEMTKQDVLAYLNSIRKPVSVDPQQRWIGSYNGRLRYLLKFFRWLHNKDEPDYRKRATPQCIQGLCILPRQEKTTYKPSDLWDSREHAIFLKYCPSVRDRCYHAMANDMSARPHEILNRTFQLHCYRGLPKYDIKEVLNPAGNRRRQRMLSALMRLRKLLVYRLMHFDEPIQDVLLQNMALIGN